jgi:transaldolase
MANESYLRWLASETATTWWNDSGDPDELTFALEHGATGVTTNPLLTNTALRAQPDFWRPLVGDVKGLTPGERAEKLIQVVVTETARRFEPIYRATDGREGYVCAQVNPNKHGDRDVMLPMGRRFAAYAPNIAVKLPVTAAGLDVLEELIAEGITVTATVSFCVPQVVQIAERHRKGAARARAKGLRPGACFAVIMIGRLDDYLRDVAHDTRANLEEADICLAGLAAAKRAYAIYQQEQYEARLLIAALRGTYHLTELAGADMVMSVHPRYQKLLLQPGTAQVERWEAPVPQAAIDRLMTLPEFVRSYEPEGMQDTEFCAYGLAQRTLSQFIESGWNPLEALTSL